VLFTLAHFTFVCSNPEDELLFVWLIEFARHYFRVAVVALFVLVFVLATTATRSDWLGLVVGGQLLPEEGASQSDRGVRFQHVSLGGTNRFLSGF
jgi:hypothetical protein